MNEDRGLTSEPKEYRPWDGRTSKCRKNFTVVLLTGVGDENDVGNRVEEDQPPSVNCLLLELQTSHTL